MALIGHRGAKGVLSPLRLTRPILVQTVHGDLSAALESNLLLPRRPWQVVTVCSHFQDERVGCQEPDSSRILGIVRPWILKRFRCSSLQPRASWRMAWRLAIVMSLWTWSRAQISRLTP